MRLTESERAVLSKMLWDTTLDELAEVVEAIVAARLAAVEAATLSAAADAWTQGAWADTPKHAERVRDRMAAAQFFGDWLRARARLAAQPTNTEAS